jgi:hypothetical protein
MRVATVVLGIAIGVCVAPTAWSQTEPPSGSASAPVAPTIHRGAAATESEGASESYAHWVVTSDLTAVLLFAGALQGPGELGYASATTYLLGSPAVHVAHGEIGKAALSLGLRFGIPITAMMVVGALNQSPHCPASDADENDIYCKPIAERVLIAGAVGLVLAMVVDPVFLARRRVPRKAAFTIEPSLGWTKVRGWSLGLQGTF